MDADKSGDLSYKEFRQAFEFMCMPLKDYQFDAMVARFDPSGKGVIKYDDFNRVIGPLIHPEARDSSRAMQSIEETSGAQSGLVFHPGAKLGGNVPFAVRTARLAAEAQLLGAKAKPQAPAFGTYSVLSGSSSSGRAQVEAFPEPEEEAAQQEGQQAQASGSSAAAAASSSSSSSSSSSAAAPAAAAPLDVAKLEERVRKALGRAWVHVAAEVKKAGGGGRGGSVAVDVLRDVLAERGVALTSREAQALASRYAAPSGGVEVDRLLSTVFKASFAGALPSKPAAAAPSVRSGSSRGAAPAAAAPAAPSAFVRSGKVSLF
jgi:hypothetical protein